MRRIALWVLLLAAPVVAQIDNNMPVNKLMILKNIDHARGANVSRPGE